MRGKAAQKIDGQKPCGSVNVKGSCAEKTPENRMYGTKIKET